VDTESLCEELKQRIVDGTDFAALAREYSNCPSGGRGGDLGSFARGQMVPEFDSVVFSAPLNQVQGPVKTQFGYHLIEVMSRQD
jgi:peptidyl-prolyl cis-trans isomerase C